MTGLSFRQRAARRGALTRREFLAELQASGFCQVRRVVGVAEQFAHPDTGDRRYIREFGQDYAATVARLRGELAAALFERRQ